MTEFVVLQASGPVVELPRPKKLIEPQTEMDPPQPAAEAPAATIEAPPEIANEAAVTGKQSVPRDSSGGCGESPRDSWVDALTAINTVAAKAAADYRSWLTEHMKDAVSGAFGYASGLASFGLPAQPESNLPVGQREHAATGGPSLHEQPQDTATVTVTCARAFAAMSANWTAGLDYARQLAEITSPADFILLVTSQTRKQVDLLLEQAAALNALTRSILAGPMQIDAAEDTAENP